MNEWEQHELFEIEVLDILKSNRVLEGLIFGGGTMLRLCHDLPRRLKIEIRREWKNWEYEEKIAFSRFRTTQVLLKGHTLMQTLRNKLEALADRGAIRDAFDIEFILRLNIPLPPLAAEKKECLLRQIRRFTPRDFKVALSSVLEKERRDYYVKNGFQYLNQKLSL